MNIIPIEHYKSKDKRQYYTIYKSYFNENIDAILPMFEPIYEQVQEQLTDVLLHASWYMECEFDNTGNYTPRLLLKNILYLLTRTQVDAKLRHIQPVIKILDQYMPTWQSHIKDFVHINDTSISRKGETYGSYFNKTINYYRHICIGI